MFSCEECEISKNTFSIEHLATTASALSQNGQRIQFQLGRSKKS